MNYIIKSVLDEKDHYLVSFNDGYEWSENINEARIFHPGNIMSIVNELCVDDIGFTVLKQQT